MKSVSFNGKALTEPVIAHRDLINGGVLSFVMDEKPQAWASHTLVRNPGLGFGNEDVNDVDLKTAERDTEEL